MNDTMGNGEVRDAMNKIKKKLNSERGASITWALLLFLVCAVIGSVVLTAGTVAAGRISQQAVSDQRYYCVTSAVQLLIDKIDGETMNGDGSSFQSGTVPDKQ